MHSIGVYGQVENMAPINNSIHMKKVLGIVFALLLFATGLSLAATSAENGSVNYEELCFSPPDIHAVNIVIIEAPKMAKTETLLGVEKTKLKEKVNTLFYACKNRPGESCNNKYLTLYETKDYTLIGYSMQEM